MTKLLRMLFDEVVSEATTGTPVVRIANVALGAIVFVIAAWIGYHIGSDLYAAL